MNIQLGMTVRVDMKDHELNGHIGQVQGKANGPYWLVKMSDGSLRGYNETDLTPVKMVTTWEPA